MSSDRVVGAGFRLPGHGGQKLMPKFKPILAGSKSGNLTVLTDKKPCDIQLRCSCACGNEYATAVFTWGQVTECTACRHRGQGNPRHSHGMAGTKIYQIWCDMVARCNRVTHQRYADYGGRGITVCERWRKFENFYADMGQRPAGRSLDRIDNNSGYSPENCRWATDLEQRQNKRPRKDRRVA